MAVFFNHRVQAPAKSAGSPHLLEWHPSFAVLAVASKNEAADANGAVHLYLDEGELVEGSSIHRSVAVECMQWHPEKTIIAIGWRSGEITTYSDSEHESFEQSSVHRAPLVFVVWNASGNRLISGDKNGLLVVWEVSSRGQPSPVPLHQHRLPAPLTHCTLHLHPTTQGKVVQGKSVLEAYSWHGRAETRKASPDSVSAFFCTSDGTLYYLTEGGDYMERGQVEGQPHFLTLHNPRQLLAVVTHNMILTQFSLDIKGETTQLMNAKLSGRHKLSCLEWTYDGVLASCAGEEVIRFWDFERGENYVLGTSTGSEVITCVSYNSRTNTLAAGTSTGCVVMWSWRPTHTTGRKHESLADCWELLSTANLSGPLVQLKWGSNKNLLAANCGDTVQILTQHVMVVHYNQQVSAMQVTPTELLVECHSSGALHPIKTDILIRGAFVTKEHMAVWSGKKLVVYSFSQDKSVTRVVGSFNTHTSTAVLHEMSVLTLDKNSIHIRTFQGTVKQRLPCGEQEGRPTTLTISGLFLAAGTDHGFVKLWDLSRREARLHGGRRLWEAEEDGVEIMSLQINCSGSHLSILCRQFSSSSTSSKKQLLLWEVESDLLKAFIPSSLHPSTPPTSSPPPITLPELPDVVMSEQLRLFHELTGKTVTEHHWDPGDGRLLAVAVSTTQEGEEGQLKGGAHTETSTVIATLFITQELTVLASNVIPLDPAHSRLIGVTIPYLCCTRKTPTAPSSSSSSTSSPHPPTSHLTTVVRLTMKDYVGLEASEPATLRAMTEFSYQSSLGHMDEALRAIKLIKSEKVWESMARMCVRTQRLDVAAVCLGNMGSARAAKAVREARSIPEPEARLAVLAVQLKMLNEAEQLYKKSRRYDLLNRFYQASGQWTKAMEVAELHDRMHLKTTYFNHARHSEASEEITAAIRSYEKSGTHPVQVPRMLFDDPLELENYVMKSKESEVHKWWAGYLESLGDCEQALQFYEMARDYPSLVRVLCSTGNYERAAEVVEESGSKAAAYLLASRLRMEREDTSNAIHFYTKAQCYSPAIQLAKENSMDSELMKLALLSSPEDMIEAAKYYEQNTHMQDKAIMLYHKAGEVSHALELCFRLKQFDVLHQIADDLSEDASPEMITRVADFFSSNGQHEKAVHLLVRSKKTEEALDMCMAQNITITEEMAEHMTLPKTPNESPAEAERRTRLLERLADCCAAQGSYHLATKKYTQGGNKSQAMKALLKSGDTDKIVFFATVSRQKDVYIMAANYLQSLDWRKDPEIMKNIITFYTKGRALESLAGFYDACAQVEIDEYQNYQKALGALSEALKCLGKAKTKNPAALEAKVTFLKERIELVRRFANARSVYGTEPEECVRQCQSLLDEPNLDTAIRTGDVYGLLVEHYAQSGNYKQAYSLMEEMRQHMPSVNMAYYINIKTIETIHSALGIPLGRGVGADHVRGGGRGGEGGESDEESVGEEVEEGY